MPTILEAQGVTKKYRNNAVLNGCDIVIDGGEIAVIRGANGCGKSTLLAVMLGHEKQTGGTVRAPKLGHGLSGYVNKPVLFPDMSGKENIAYFMEISGRLFPERECLELMERFDLCEDNKRAATYSTGIQKKYGVIRSLLLEPELLILDEPFSGIDEKATETLGAILSERARDRAMAILLTTHEHNIIAAMRTTNYAMRDGILVPDAQATRTDS